MNTVSENQHAIDHSSIISSQPKVVIEDISSQIAAVQLQALEMEEKTHYSSPRCNTDKKYLRSLQPRLAIRWPDMDNKKAWEEFEDKVMSTLPSTGSSSFRLTQLEEGIYV